MNSQLVLHRFLQMMLTIGVMSFLVYVLIGLMPGDPVDLLMAGNPHMTPEDVARLKALYGLDRPVLERYGRWLATLFQGNAGYSRLYGLPVLEVLLPRLLHTFCLMGASLLLTVLVAVPLGVYTAYVPYQKPGGGHFMRKAWVNFVYVFCLTGLSMPAFWLALLLISLFSVHLGWLPASAALTEPASLILPVVTLSFSGLAVYVRHLQRALNDSLMADHVKTAVAKGCSPARVVWNHAFKNALPTMVTLFMLDLGALFGGAVTIETIFAYPGMGKLMFDAILGNDFNLALVGFLILTAVVILGNFLADVAYLFLDPRVRQAT